jgi:hypothetical protein
VSPALSVRLDYARSIEMDARGARIVEILGVPSLGLSRIAASTQKEKTKYEPATPQRLTELIACGDYFDLSLESASKELENRVSLALQPRIYDQAASPLTCSMAILLHQDQPLIKLLAQLADALGASAGFVAIEPTPSLAYKLAVGSSIPSRRDGLSDDRRRARRAHDKWHEQISAKIATVEWGTFLGLEHLGQVDLDKLRASGAFARVEAVSPSLAFVQLTPNPLDDLSSELEQRVLKAREALGTLLIDSSGVHLE